jgi:CRP/FNR family transcriptional regulator
MQSDVAALSASKIFATVPLPQLEELATCVRHRHFRDGEAIFREGDPALGLFVLRSGEVRISITSPVESDIVLAVLSPGEMFGELAIFDGTPRSAAATAIGATELLFLHRDDVIGLLEREPAAVRAVLHVLASMVRRTNEKLADVAMLDVHGRMAKALLELVDRYGVETHDGLLIEHPVTTQDLAALTGMYEVEVDRLMRNYQYEDIVRVSFDRITVRSPDELRSWI